MTVAMCQLSDEQGHTLCPMPGEIKPLSSFSNHRQEAVEF